MASPEFGDEIDLAPISPYPSFSTARLTCLDGSVSQCEQPSSAFVTGSVP